MFSNCNIFEKGVHIYIYIYIRFHVALYLLNNKPQ